MELRIITNEEPKKGVITIDDSVPGKPMLINGNEVINKTSLVKIDILEKLLQERDWNIPGRIIMEGSEFYLSTKEGGYSSAIPVIDSEDEKILLKEFTNYEIEYRVMRSFISAHSFQAQEYRGFLQNIVNYLGAQEDRPGSIITLEEDYTNIINFNRFIQEGYKLPNVLTIESYKMTAQVTIGVCYKDSRMNKNIYVCPFSVSKKYNKINTNQYIKYQDTDIILAETRDGVLRIFPLVPEVKECVILSCTIFYEKLE